jgi:hypothetical protein
MRMCRSGGQSGGEVEGVLITGVYGAGKSSIAEEIADARSRTTVQ